MRRLLLFSLAVLFFSTGLHAQDSALAALQGRWTVAAAEHRGKPFDLIKGGVMTVSGSDFEIRTATGNLLRGKLQLDNSTRPFHMDLLHADGDRWEAIYETSGDSFRLNYVEANGKEPRPQTFTTSDTTEATVISLTRTR